MVDPDMEALVLDNGSGMCKCGFSGDDAPRASFPMIVGRIKNPSFFSTFSRDGDVRDCFVGDEAFEKRGILKLKFPIQRGMVINWNDMEKVWNHVFYNELRVTPEEHPILITEPPLNPKDDREKMLNTFFETFNVPAMYLAVQSVLSLLASGRNTGIVLDSGDGVTHAVPVYEGLSIPHAVLKMNVSGRYITMFLTKMLSERGIKFKTNAERGIIFDVKEKYCYVANNFQSEMEKVKKTTFDYELPDGKKLNIEKERFYCPEILFNPSLYVDNDSCIPRFSYGIHELIYNSIRKIDFDMRRDLYENIVLSGGSTMFKGIVERLKNEIQNLVPKNTKIKVNAPERRKFLVWMGGSILTSLDVFKDMWIIKDDYEEMGNSIIHRKCF